MYKCNYCGRYLKNQYDVCPGCGSSSFETKSFMGEKVIKTPPNGGYIIQTKDFVKAKKTAKFLTWFGIIWIVFTVMSTLPFLVIGLISLINLASEDFGAEFGLAFILLPSAIDIIFIAVGVLLIVCGKKEEKKHQTEIDRVQKLAKTGTLVKNIPYEIERSSITDNNGPVYQIKITYKNASGVEIPLLSNPKYGGVLGSKSGTADLLIDENDYSNYYIDFEIY